jgi:hypothetical protein
MLSAAKHLIALSMFGGMRNEILRFAQDDTQP